MSSVISKTNFLSDREKKDLAILENLRFHGPLSKADIALNIGLNAVTTSNYINNLLKRKIVLEKELDVSQGGRRPVLLDLNPQAAYFIGVGLNLLNMVGVLVDLKGNVITRTRRDRPPSSAREISDCILQTISGLMDKQNGKNRIKGIGIGIAGIVNKKEGSIRWPERIGNGYTYASIYLPLKELIEKEFGLTTFVENDATAACFGEKWMSLDPEIKNVLYMFSGVGCGLIINGEIYRGATGSAGEVSINDNSGHNGFNCVAGAPCLVKRWDADLGLVSEAKRILEKDYHYRNSRILELVSGNIESVSAREIFVASKENDPLAVDLVKAAGHRLGVKIAYLINLLNPEIVIIGGGIEEAGNLFLETVKHAASQWAFEDMFNSVKIIYSTLGENAVALGAATLSMRHIFAYI